MSSLENYFEAFVDEGEQYDHLAATAAAARKVETMAAQQTIGRYCPSSKCAHETCVPSAS